MANVYTAEMMVAVFQPAWMSEDKEKALKAVYRLSDQTMIFNVFLMWGIDL